MPARDSSPQPSTRDGDRTGLTYDQRLRAATAAVRLVSATLDNRGG